MITFGLLAGFALLIRQFGDRDYEFTPGVAIVLAIIADAYWMAHLAQKIAS